MRGVLLVLSLLPSIAIAQQPAAIEARPRGALRVEQALDAIWLERRLEAWPELSLAMRDLARAELPGGSFAWLESAVARHFGAIALREAILERQLGRGDDGRLDAALAWQASPAAAAVARAEERARSPEGLRRYPLFLAELRREGRPAERLAGARRLDGALGLSDDVLRVALATAAAFGTGLERLDCEARHARDELAERARQSVLQRHRIARTEIRLGLLFSQQSLGDAERRRHADFAESPSAVELRHSLAGDLGLALLEAQRRLERDLASQRSARCPDGAASR